MNYPEKSLDPADRLGVYKRLSNVPNRYRLHHHADTYEDNDTWHTFCMEFEYQEGSHDRYEEEVDRIGSRWKDHMGQRERHHALARPADVEAWCERLLSEKAVSRTYEHWLRVKRFYHWLMWHSEHPHVYNPVLMAAITGESTGEAWAWKARRNRERRERYRRSSDE